MGVREHLDAALAQGAGYIQFVIYDLPGRDCSALASNGELGPDELPRYKTEYIDPIAAIQADAEVRAACGSSTSSRSTRCRTWSPTPPASPAARPCATR